ncbi:porin family protein, partial [Brevundimonas sp. BAL450]
MKLKLLAGVAAAGLFAATSASAEPDGWYGAIDLGGHWMEDGINARSDAGPAWEWEVNDGWAAFARLGYRLNPNWRVELEGGHRSGDIGTVRRFTDAVPSGLCNLTPATGPCHSPEGDIESKTLFINAIYDIGSPDWAFRPFVGLGVGANMVSIDTIGNLRGDRSATLAADDDTTELAFQALAGFAWAVGERANIDLTYRYLTGDTSWDTTTVGAPALGSFEGDYDFSHTVTVGLRYAFGPVAAPPPPPP